jgi:hypothetical protein
MANSQKEKTKMTNEQENQAKARNRFKILLAGAMGFIGGIMLVGYGTRNNISPAEIRPVRINEANGYELISASRGTTNYYISTSGFNVERINPNEQITSATPKYHIQRDFREGNK